MCLHFLFSSIARLAIGIAALILSVSACGVTAAPAATLPAVDASTVVAADPGSSLPAGWQHGAFIEIYVRGYKDSDGDGIGDLRGVIQSLDYLKDLGIKGIWLMPVTRSQDRDHGYAVSDYRNIETGYGGLADFDALLQQAHARGIGIIIDYVINHSAADNPLFLHSQASASGAYRDWYLWQTARPSGWNIFGGNPWRAGKGAYYFSAFSEQMPDFNLMNPAVMTYHHDNLRFWLNRGVDGFRFDAVGHLVENGRDAWDNQPQNYPLMGGVRQLLNTYAQRWMVCEAPSDALGFAAPSACGSAFAFGHSGDIVNAAKGNANAILQLADYFKTTPGAVSTMVSSHDAYAGQRLFDQVGGNLAQYRLAAATYLLQPGTPFIYYGEEIGMAGAASLNSDPSLRTPMSWTADSRTAGFTSGQPFRALSANVGTQNAVSQQADPNSLLSFYKAMLKLRNSLPSIARGSYDAPFVTGSVMGFQRMFGSERTLVLINYGTAASSVKVGGLVASGTLVPAYPGGAATLAADAFGSAQIAIDAQSVLVFSLRP